MQQNKETGGRVQLMLPDRTIPFEITADCTLPDYRSEISRLLWVRPTLTPPERFIGGGKAELSGKILLEILYTGPDGVLYGTEHEQGYSFTLPLESTPVAEEIEVFATPVVDTVISRVTGPRRLSVRCRSHATVRGVAQASLALQQHALPEGEKPHLLCKEEKTGVLIGGGREEWMLSDDVPCEEDTRVLCARGSVFLSDVHAAEDEVRVGGEALISLLCCREESEMPLVLEKRVPFERRVALAGVSPEHRACASGTIGRVEVTVEEGQISFSPHLILTAEAVCDEPVTLCHDLFLPGHRAECRFEELSARRPGLCTNRNFSISAEQALQELGLGEEIEIADHICEAEICEKSTESGKTVWNGKLQCHLLCRRGDEFCVQNAALPFRLCSGADLTNAHTECRVSACRLRVQNGTLRADAELQFSLCDAEPLALRSLCEATFAPSAPVPRAAIELYYPAPTQTLWDVAKAHGVCPEALAAANALDAEAPGEKDSLSGKKFLLIP